MAYKHNYILKSSSYSWGYKKVFEQYANILREKYPEISILGDNYPPPDWKLWMAQMLVSTLLWWL